MEDSYFDLVEDSYFLKKKQMIGEDEWETVEGCARRGGDGGYHQEKYHFHDP